MKDAYVKRKCLTYVFLSVIMPDVKQNSFIVNALLRSALSERAKMKDLSLGVLNELYGGFLTDIQRDMIRSYYDYDLSLGEIAEQNGVTRQAVADALKKGEKALRSCEERMGIMSRRAELARELDELCKYLDEGDGPAARKLAEDIRNKL